MIFFGLELVANQCLFSHYVTAKPPSEIAHWQKKPDFYWSRVCDENKLIFSLCHRCK